MKQKRFLLIILSVAMPMFVSSQSTFFKRFQTTDNSCGVKSIETPSHDFLIIGGNGFYSSFPQGMIMKINSNGDLIEKLVFHDDVNASNLLTINQSTSFEGQYLLTGYKDSIVDNVSNCIIKLYIINDSITFLSERSFNSGPELFVYPWQLKPGGNNSFYLLCTVDSVNQPTSSGQFCVIKFNIELDSISAYFPQGSSSHIGDLLYDEKQKKVDIFYFGPYITKSGSSMKVLELDSNLNYIASLSLPENIITEPSATYLTDTTYILTGVTHKMAIAQFISTYLMTYDHDSLKRQQIFGDPDTVLYAGATPNTAINGESIFISGLYNIHPFEYPWQSTPSWIQVTRLDRSLNIISNNFYGGDAFYSPYSIIATSDGGAFLTGFRYDLQTHLFDVFALKVDTNGAVTGEVENERTDIAGAILAPNPAHDKVSAIVGAQYTSADLFLYDLNGKQVFYKQLQNNRQIFDISGLKPGSYFYLFTSRNKKIGKGKLVKLR